MESYEIIWKTALPELEDSVFSMNYQIYIQKAKPIDLIDTTFVLMVSTELQASMLRKNLYEKILLALKKVNSEISDVKVFVGNNKNEYEASKLEESSMPQVESSPINPNYTFDSFVVGDSNRYLYAAAKAVAENPSNSYNPLFIYGDSGLGKTHIMHAIANYIMIHHPKKHVLYATCEAFTTELIRNLRNNKAYSKEGEEFRNRYRNVDVLIIDDVQFLAKKETTQEEFFHTFNALYGANKQIILSADCEPKEIEKLDNRLQTRFDGGLKAQVIAPNLETKIAILQKKASFKKHILSIDVATYIAENSEANVRNLEGLLNKVIFSATLHEAPITLDLAIEALKESVSQENTEMITSSKIIDTVCSFYKINKSELLSKKRNKEIAEPRQVCAYLMTELMSVPLVTIGQALGGQNYATIIHSRDKISELIKLNDRIATDVKDLKNLILKK